VGRGVGLKKNMAADGLTGDGLCACGVYVWWHVWRVGYGVGSEAKQTPYDCEGCKVQMSRVRALTGDWCPCLYSDRRTS
jgi:hypothetical protein